MFVQATDLKLYKNPVIIGDGWYVRFMDGEEQPEIILKSQPRMTLASGKRAIKRVLVAKGFSATIKTEGNEGVNPFPPTWNGMVKSFSWLFTVTGQIPIPTTFDSVINYPSAHSHYLAWTLQFPIEDIHAYLVKKEYRPILIQFLSDMDVMEHAMEIVRKTMLVRLYRQLPGLKQLINKKASVADLESKFGKTVLLRKKKCLR